MQQRSATRPDARLGRTSITGRLCTRMAHSRQGQRVQAVAGRTETASIQRLAELVSWSKSQGVSVEKVEATSSLENGRAILVAAKDISAGEAVLAINDTAWVSTEAVCKSKIGKAVEGLEPWLQIALYLISSRTSGSDFGPYINTMPEQPFTPLFWSDEQLSMLQGSQLLDTLNGYRAFFDAKYTELFGPQGLLSSQSALFPASIYTYQNFVAAIATVRSRSHAPLDGAGLALVPLADAVSHKRQGNTTWKVKSTGLFGGGQTLVVEATKAIRKGEELSMDYAPDKLDGGVLLDYGVIDSQDLRPGYTLTLSLSPSDRLFDDKIDVIENTPGLSQDMQFQLTNTSVPSETMLGFLRLNNLKGGDVFLLEPVFRNDVWSFMIEPISEDNEKTVCISMAEGARAALSGYATTIDADLAFIRSKTFAQGSPEEAAVRVCLGEKESLDMTGQWFEERLTTLKRLTYYQERRLRRLGLIDDEGRTTYDSFFKDGIA